MTLVARNPDSITQQPTAFDLFDPARFAVMERMAQTLLDSGMLPQALKQPAQVITIMLKSYELGVPPMEGLNGINVIQGKPTVTPQLMLALIERSKTGNISIVTREDKTSVVVAHRHGRAPREFVFTWADATALNLTSKPNYKSQPAVMLQWRNVAAAARAVFPDVISGMYTPEEMGADVEVLEDGSQVIQVAPEATEATFAPARETPVEPPQSARVNKVTQGGPITPSEAQAVNLEDIPGVSRGAPPAPDGDAPISAGQVARLAREFAETDATDQDRYAVYSLVLSRPITTGADVFSSEFKPLLGALETVLSIALEQGISVVEAAKGLEGTA